MKKLYLVRHAKSSWDNLDLADFDRPLNNRGEIDDAGMGKRLKERGVHPDLMISSPAVRALATCQEMARAIGYDERKIVVDKRLYHADEEQLLSVVKQLSRHVGEMEAVVLFGHNPGLTEFANRLLDDTIDNIPTCGIVAGDLNIKSWKEASWACGEREFFELPKQIGSL